MYSDSVLDRDTAPCFFELQEMAPPASMNTKPDVGLRSFTSLAQSASTYPCNVIPPGTPRLKMSCEEWVACSQRNAQSRGRWWPRPGVAACIPTAGVG